MSDFLTHLAERAVAQFPVVRPSVRSHIEPALEGEITWPAALSEVEKPPAASPLALPTAGEKKVLTEKFTPPQAPTSPRLAAVLEDEPLPVAVPAPVRFADGIGRGQDARTTGGAGILPAAFSAPPALHPATVVPGAGTPLPVRSTEIKGSGQNARATGGAGILPAVAPTKFPPPAATALSNQPSARAVAPQPPPQVIITIGRVEIRAAALPVHPITPVVSGPPLSLETYLRRSASRTA